MYMNDMRNKSTERRYIWEEKWNPPIFYLQNSKLSCEEVIRRQGSWKASHELKEDGCVKLGTRCILLSRQLHPEIGSYWVD